MNYYQIFKYLLSIGIISTVVIYLILKKYGFFYKMDFQQTQLPKLPIIYKQYQGIYHQIGPKYQLFSKQTYDHFPKSKCFGIFYDNPEAVKDKSKCRAIYGKIISQNQQLHIQEFIKSKTDYKISYILSSKVVKGIFPYVSKLSYLALVKNGYPSLFRYMATNYQKEMNELKDIHAGVIQIYNFDEQNKNIQLIIALQNTQFLRNLTQLPLPDDKKSK